MEILIFLLKLSSNAFSYWEDVSQLRKKKKKNHSNLGGSPDNLVILLYLKRSK